MFGITPPCLSMDFTQQLLDGIGISGIKKVTHYFSLILLGDVVATNRDLSSPGKTTS